ncbi:MAG: response regulator [Candidatus Rokubacteria bacterium]|nr:response regulator [Candidatus Rokubacteria bacterium]
MLSAAVTPGERIAMLLVEDDADQAEVVARTLRRQDSSFEVTAVGDGLACLEALTRQSYALVLLDYSLPRLSGLEVLAEIRRRGESVPVVMVTGQGDERVAVEAMRAGASDYVIKSSGYLTTLPTVIRKVLKQHELVLENARLYAEAQRSLAELQAAQEKLVEGATLRALGEMASGAAHHLNNLLAVVLGRAQLLLQTADVGACRRPLEAIARAAGDAAEVVRRVQRFARMGASEERQELDLNALAREVLEMTQPRWQDQAQARGVPIEVVLRAGTVGPVSGNPPALREVVMNLVLNTVDALPAGGRIEIRTFLEGKRACLAVADSGMGMPDEVRGHALEPFFTTKGPKGTGLGLSVSYGIVKSHGGELDLQSAPGRGTVATVRLPVVAACLADEGVGPASGRERTPVTPQHILIVDDDEEVRSMLVDLVAGQGHDVLQAASGREALALLDGGTTIDLVLTDLGMPGMTGWELARTIRSRWPRLAVGLVTGWGNQVDVPPADSELIIGTVAKPVSPEALKALIVGARGRLEADDRNSGELAGAPATERLPVSSGRPR